MRVFDAQQTAELLPYTALIAGMNTAFASRQLAPPRHHHTMPMNNEVDAALLLMPCWNDDIGCVKIVTVVPGNSARSLPSIAGNVLVFDRKTGKHLAIFDGAVITARRTAAASALAAIHLAPDFATRLLILGSGKVAAELPHAFSAVRAIKTITVWNRNCEGAKALAASLREQGFDAQHSECLETAVRETDIISAATLATEPLIKGEWLQSAQHVDLLGAFTPLMREADDLALQRSSIYVDTVTAHKEAGELCIPLAAATIKESDILGTLYDLCQHGHVARQSKNEITLFKSVGNAVMDFAATMVATKGAGL